MNTTQTKQNPTEVIKHLKIETDPTLCGRLQSNTPRCVAVCKSCLNTIVYTDTQLDELTRNGDNSLKVFDNHIQCCTSPDYWHPNIQRIVLCHTP